MNRFWLNFLRQPYWEGENGGSGAGATGAEEGGAGSGAGAGGKGAGEAASGTGKGSAESGADGADQKPISLRASVAQTLEGDERSNFEGWANQYNDDASFAKAVGSMRRQFDTRVPVPKADDKPEVVSKYFERVGKPTEPKGYLYDFGKDEKTGQPVKLSDRELADFEGYKEYAHKNHFTQGQFKAALDFLFERDRKQETEFTGRINEAHQRSVDQLREEWGADFDNNAAHAVEGGILYAESEEAWRSFVELPLADGMKVGDHPTFLRTMAKVGRATGEDQRVREMRNSGEAENIKAEITRIEEEAMKAGKLPSDPDVHARLEPLYKKLYPKKHSGSHGSGFGAGQ